MCTTCCPLRLASQLGAEQRNLIEFPKTIDSTLFASRVGVLPVSLSFWNKLIAVCLSLDIWWWMFTHQAVHSFSAEASLQFWCLKLRDWFMKRLRADEADSWVKCLLWNSGGEIRALLMRELNCFTNSLSTVSISQKKINKTRAVFNLVTRLATQTMILRS